MMKTKSMSYVFSNKAEAKKKIESDTNLELFACDVSSSSGAEDLPVYLSPMNK